MALSWLCTLAKTEKNMKYKTGLNKIRASAFSLVEMSLVILIIGVLVAGVTQSTNLIRKSKLATARDLTQGSPVASTDGLLLWLESTQAKSFKESETSDGKVLTSWYDSNPQTTMANGFSANSAKITYKASATNSLPAVAFADNNTAFVGSIFDSPFNSYTIFYVARPTSLANTDLHTVFYNGVVATNGFGAGLDGSSGRAGRTKLIYGSSFAVFGSAQAVAKQRDADIVCITIAPNNVLGANITNPKVASYRNGVLDMNRTISSAKWIKSTGNLFIGNASQTSTSHDFIGEISEIIVFDNVLKNSDRQEIEKYLGRKYDISL